MTTVLAAIDGSEVSGPVLDMARTLAAILHRDLSALHVGDDPRAQRAADVRGVDLRLATGVPEEVIRTEMDRADVILGVIGARGQREGRQPAGHLACELAQHTAIPLAVIPPDVVVPEHAPFGPVVVPVEGSSAVTAAVQDVVSSLFESGLAIVGVHVFHEENRPLFWDRPRYESDDWRREFSRRFCHRGTNRLLVRSGLPGRVVIDVAHELDAGLIVLGWSQDLSRGRADTVRHVLAQSPCPVLLVPSAKPTENSTRPRWTVGEVPI